MNGNLRDEWAAWIAWFAANWQLISLFVVGVVLLGAWFDRHPETAERICDRIAGR